MILAPYYSGSLDLVCEDDNQDGNRVILAPYHSGSVDLVCEGDNQDGNRVILAPYHSGSFQRVTVNHVFQKEAGVFETVLQIVCDR